MHRRAGTSLLVLISVLLALAGPVAAGTKATFAAGVGVAYTAVLRQLMTTTTRLEDSVAPELTVDVELHRRVLAGGVLKPPVFKPDTPACPGSCAAHGGKPYSRGCEAIYQCVPGAPRP